MKHHPFFKAADFNNAMHRSNPEQKPDYKVDADFIQLKKMLLETLENFVKNFPWFKNKDGRNRAIAYKNDLQNFAGSAMALLRKTYEDISKPHGEKPLETSTELRMDLLNTLCNFFKVPERELNQQITQQLYSGGMFLDNGAMITQTRFDVTKARVRTEIQKYQNCEMKIIRPGRN